VVLEEEKRLCYVAMTRAKTELVMTWRKEVPIFTREGIRTVDRIRSRFLDVLVSTKEETDGAQRQSSGRGTTNMYSSSRSSAARGQQFRTTEQKSTKGSSNPRYATPVRATPVQKYEGTTRVLGKQRKSPFDLTTPSVAALPKQAGTNKTRPSLLQAARAKQSLNPPGIERPSLPRVTARLESPASLKVAPAPERHLKAVAKQPRIIDSTWFFPVGSEVLHKDFGKGVVQSPPEGGLAVRVQFDKGSPREFPVHGTDISPVVC
jgi:ATP-dependent exoDNAse (exonuclease V) beta subunit